MAFLTSALPDVIFLTSAFSDFIDYSSLGDIRAFLRYDTTGAAATRIGRHYVRTSLVITFG